MLVLKRKEGEWIHVTHNKTGESMRFRIYAIRGGEPARACLAFDDDARNFSVERPERGRIPGPATRGEEA